MKKDILKDCIKNLGIEEGDIIGLRYKGEYVYFKHTNGVFWALNMGATDMLSEQEVYELISGMEEFEIIARGVKPDYKSLDKKVDELITYHQNEAKEIEIQKEKDKKFLTISGFVWLGLVAIVLIIKSILGL